MPHPPSRPAPNTRPLRSAHAALALLALALDAAGVAADFPPLWHAGYFVMGAAAVTGAILCAALALGPASPPRRLAAVAAGAAGAALLALGAWVRGDAAVPPDPPVVGAAAIAALLFWLARRATARAAGVSG